MLFPTITFALFFMVVLPTSWLLMHQRFRWQLFILAASYFFYGYYDWRFCFLLAGSTLVNQMIGLQIYSSERESVRKAWLTLGIVANLGGLAYFKYYDFFVSNARNALGHVGIDVSSAILSITLPIGISFFTFQALSYVIDIYRRQFEPVKLLDFAVYLSFFPHLIAGPIVRAAEFLPQLKERHDPRRIDASRAFFLIVIGLFKKVVIANFLATHIVDIVFATPNRQSSLTLLVGVYAYAVQIYADFSGYTDMAIGLALLIGFRFPQNFDGPYTATSLQDFWRRWHMTLSRWLRDYLYIPLGGNRGSRRQPYRNLMLTFVIGGLWHGAAWTFVLWGAYQGLVLVVYRSVMDWGRRMGWRVAAGFGAVRLLLGVVMFHVTCAGWLIFRARSVHQIGRFAWRVLTDLRPSPDTFDSLLVPLVSLTLPLVLLQIYQARKGLELAVLALPGPVRYALASTLFYLVLLFGDFQGAQFIYFQF